MRDALAGQHMGQVIAAYRRHPYHPRPFPQEHVGRWVGVSQGQLSRIENGLPIKNLDALVLWARTLGIPRNLLWFDLPPGSEKAPPDRPPRTAGVAESSGPSGSPALAFQELAHIAAVLDHGRDVDASVVSYLQRQLVSCATDDGDAGPQRTLPQVLGILAVVERQARHLRPPLRRDLLEVGAHSAEFAGWLYRDLGNPRLADHWRDRAFEWAAEIGDLPMCGYILLKKSQAAWDRRDAATMLSLAQAAQQSTWQVPAQVQAEAAQQEARGHAMVGSGQAIVEAKLDDAHTALAEAEPTTASAREQLTPGAHYGSVLLTMQTAICYTECQQPARAVDLYRQRLRRGDFSHRDYGYFLALSATSLADMHEPYEAAQTALQAITIAEATSSTRTIDETRRTAAHLAPWADLPEIQDLHDALASAA